MQMPALNLAVRMSRHDRRASRAGTTTRRSTTGRTRARSDAATCPSGATLAVQAGGPVLELGCGTGRIALPLARAGVPSSASIAPTRCSRAPASASSARRARVAADSRRHPIPAVQPARHGRSRLPRASASQRRRFPLVHGAVRHAAVAAARTRSRGDARRRCIACSSRAARSASSWSRTCRRGRSIASASASRAGGRRRRRARHARRDRPPGPQQAPDDLRSGVHRAPRRDDAVDARSR